MKFAKELAAKANPKWIDKYISYKGLKKVLKLVENAREAAATGSSSAFDLDSAIDAISHQFVDTLQDELDKINDFVEEIQRYIIQSRQNVDDVKRGLLDSSVLGIPSSSKDADLESRIAAFEKHLWSLLLELRDYVELNYIGFYKAAKKHDKVTGLHILNQVMAAVDMEPFMSVLEPTSSLGISGGIVAGGRTYNDVVGRPANDEGFRIAADGHAHSDEEGNSSGSLTPIFGSLNAGAIAEAARAAQDSLVIRRNRADRGLASAVGYARGDRPVSIGFVPSTGGRVVDSRSDDTEEEMGMGTENIDSLRAGVSDSFQSGKSRTILSDRQSSNTLSIPYTSSRQLMQDENYFQDTDSASQTPLIGDERKNDGSQIFSLASFRDDEKRVGLGETASGRISSSGSSKPFSPEPISSVAGSGYSFSSSQLDLPAIGTGAPSRSNMASSSGSVDLKSKNLEVQNYDTMTAQTLADIVRAKVRLSAAAADAAAEAATLAPPRQETIIEHDSEELSDEEEPIEAVIPVELAPTSPPVSDRESTVETSVVVPVSPVATDSVREARGSSSASMESLATTTLLISSPPPPTTEIQSVSVTAEVPLEEELASLAHLAPRLTEQLMSGSSSSKKRVIRTDTFSRAPSSSALLPVQTPKAVAPGAAEPKGAAVPESETARPPISATTEASPSETTQQSVTATVPPVEAAVPPKRTPLPLPFTVQAQAAPLTPLPPPIQPQAQVQPSIQTQTGKTPVTTPSTVLPSPGVGAVSPLPLTLSPRASEDFRSLTLEKEEEEREKTNLAIKAVVKRTDDDFLEAYLAADAALAIVTPELRHAEKERLKRLVPFTQALLALQDDLHEKVQQVSSSLRPMSDQIIRDTALTARLELFEQMLKSIVREVDQTFPEGAAAIDEAISAHRALFGTYYKSTSTQSLSGSASSPVSTARRDRAPSHSRLELVQGLSGGSMRFFPASHEVPSLTDDRSVSGGSVPPRRGSHAASTESHGKKHRDSSVSVSSVESAVAGSTLKTKNVDSGKPPRHTSAAADTQTQSQTPSHVALSIDTSGRKRRHLSESISRPSMRDVLADEKRGKGSESESERTAKSSANFTATGAGIGGNLSSRSHHSRGSSKRAQIVSSDGSSDEEPRLTAVVEPQVNVPLSPFKINKRKKQKKSKDNGVADIDGSNSNTDVVNDKRIFGFPPFFAIEVPSTFFSHRQRLPECNSLTPSPHTTVPMRPDPSQLNLTSVDETASAQGVSTAITTSGALTALATINVAPNDPFRTASTRMIDIPPVLPSSSSEIHPHHTTDVNVDWESLDGQLPPRLLAQAHARQQSLVRQVDRFRSNSSSSSSKVVISTNVRSATSAEASETRDSIIALNHKLQRLFDPSKRQISLPQGVTPPRPPPPAWLRPFLRGLGFLPLDSDELEPESSASASKVDSVGKSNPKDSWHLSDSVPTPRVFVRRIWELYRPAICEWLPEYKWTKYLKDDIVAGVTSAIVLVPQGLGYATLAGLPPVYGIYTGFPGFIYAILGTSHHAAIGPMSIPALLISAGIMALTQGPQTDAEYVGLVMTITFMVGVLLLIMGWLRLGFIVRFISRPVLNGFTSAAAVLTMMSCLKDLFRVPLPRASVLQDYLINLDLLANLHGVSTVVSMSALFLLLMFPKWGPTKNIPASLIVVLLYIALFWVVMSATGDPGEVTNPDGSISYATVHGVQLVGSISGSLPGFAMPKMPTGDQILSLLPTVISVTFVGFIESVAVAKMYAIKHSYDIEVSSELKALGSTNVFASMVQSFPVMGALGRSSIQESAGGRTQLATIISCGVVAILLVLIMPMIFYLPKPVLGAMITAAIKSLFNWSGAKLLWKVDKKDLLTMAAGFFLTLFLGVLQGVLVAMLFSMVVFVALTTQPKVEELGRLSGTVIYKHLGLVDVAKVPEVKIIRFLAPLFFANSSVLREKMLKELASRKKLPPRLQWRALVLCFASVSQIDSTSAQTLTEAILEYHAQGVPVLIASANVYVEKTLMRTGLTSTLGGPKFLFRRVHEAVRAILLGRIKPENLPKRAAPPKKRKKRPGPIKRRLIAARIWGREHLARLLESIPGLMSKKKGSKRSQGKDAEQVKAEAEVANIVRMHSRSGRTRAGSLVLVHDEIGRSKELRNRKKESESSASEGDVPHSEEEDDYTDSEEPVATRAVFLGVRAQLPTWVGSIIGKVAN